MARILLAEDDASMRDMAQRALAADGHTVVAAQDGLEALDRLAAGGAAFDILLTDVDMPGLDGLALSTKALAMFPSLKVVLMTAYADIVSVPAPIAPSVAQTLTKPLSLDALRAAIRKTAGG